MSIRSNARPTGFDLSLEFQDVLRRNGMQAHIIPENGTLKLFVQGHDSPMLKYDLSAEQVKKLTDWGTNYANKSAYNTFVKLVDKDFYLPRNFVHARNANGRVAMGLHGYRIGVGEYGRMPFDSAIPLRQLWGYHFLGWTPRQQGGFHMRRIQDTMYMQGAPIVPGRPDGRMKPGELQNGGYGFYYKGQQRPPEVPSVDVLKDLESVIKPMKTESRPHIEAKPYKELITSPVYFSNDKFQEALSSHGILVDTQAKTLTIQSSSTDKDLIYDLNDEELGVLTSNSLKQVPLQQRLDLLNDIVSADYSDTITMETLNSKEVININLKPEVMQEIQARETAISKQLEVNQPLDAVSESNAMHINGNVLSQLNENKAWYREGRNGEQVTVDDIKVENHAEGKYRMTAVINGESITHEISQKQYEKFSAIDDYHRLKLFSKVFDEVDMKTIPGKGFNLLAAVAAGVTATRELIAGARYDPVVFEERYDRPHVYFKPGVDSPQALAQRAFDAGVTAAETGVGMGHQR